MLVAIVGASLTILAAVALTACSGKGTEMSTEFL